MTKINIVYCMGEKESSEAIVNALNHTGISSVLSREPLEAERCIAWGKSVDVPALNGQIDRGKFQQLKILNDAGIPSLKATCDKIVAAKWLEEGNYVFKRRWPRASGAQLQIFNPRQGVNSIIGCDIESGDYFTRGVASPTEYRFHIFRGLSIYQYIKPTTDIVRFSSENVGEELTIGQLREIAMRAVGTIEYDFGGVDILGTGEVVEVNTAPTVVDICESAYVEACKRWINNE